jgi:peptidoglycan/xylan/chitin deacetylase (PgdA/CDA1 family)
LASHRAAGHISGICLEVTGGMEGRIIWREAQILGDKSKQSPNKALPTYVPRELAPPSRKRKMRICLSVDFDAISGYLGTGHDEHTTMSDYSAGIFSANVGVGRLLRLFKKHGISKDLTWFTPAHSLETFPQQARKIIESGAEIGLHGYSHEGAYAMTVQQELDVLQKCIEVVTELQNGRRPVGYRAPLYQIRETTVKLLQEQDFLYDSSMNAHDSMPYFLPKPFPGKPPHVPDYAKEASSWMKPTDIPAQPERATAEAADSLVEIPGSWYTEDMTPLGFYPYAANTQGYVSVDVVEKIWWDRFDWLWENECWTDDGPGKGFGSVFPMIWHPESAGRAHIVGMIDKFIGKLVARKRAAGEGEITFETMETVARSWRDGS